MAYEDATPLALNMDAPYLALIAAILLTREGGIYDVKTIIEEANDLLRGAEEHVRAFPPVTVDALVAAEHVATKLREQLDGATHMWAKRVVEMNRAAGPRERDILEVLRDINTVRHEAGLPLFIKETDVIGKAQW